MFNDMHNICELDSEELCQEYGPAPYSGLGFIELMTNKKGDQHWDNWSVAVIILEIIIGSEFVVKADTYE